MGHIFISYSHKDKDYVHKLAENMQSEGFEVWIDDRIDYGTRWTRVIEDAVDACDAFVLVASENSHRSEWVQNELLRAQRKEKKIFPILLSGDSWISMESTQFFDARTEVLPNQKFYNDLRNYLKRHLEWLRSIFIESWPVYRDDKIGFSVNYPIRAIVQQSSKGVVKIDMPVVDGTNLRNNYLSIHCREDGILSSPLCQNQMSFEKSHVEILGQRFLRESGAEGAAGTAAEWVSYSISRGNRVVTVSITLMYQSRDLYFPELMPEIDLSTEKETLDYVVSTFSWLK